MHELSIALSMIEMAHEEVVRRGGCRVTALHLKLGPLSGVVREALEFSYGELSPEIVQGRDLEVVALEIEEAEELVI